jgi:hypothetical protein
MDAEKYCNLLRAYLEKPTATHVMQACKQGPRLVNRAIVRGWPELGLPPLRKAGVVFTDPIEVHKKMAEMEELQQQVRDNLLKPIELPEKVADLEEEQVARLDATKRVAEQGMAARVSLSMAARTAKIVDMLALKILDLVETGKLELPETATPALINLLARTADIAASTVEKAVKISRLQAGEPEHVIGVNIGAALSSATPDELAYVLRTGLLPPRVMGLVGGLPENREGAIDVQPDEPPPAEEDEDLEQEEGPVAELEEELAGPAPPEAVNE